MYEAFEYLTDLYLSEFIVGILIISIIVVVIIIGGYMVYTNYMQNEEIVVIEEDMNISVNPDDVVAE